MKAIITIVIEAAKERLTQTEQRTQQLRDSIAVLQEEVAESPDCLDQDWPPYSKLANLVIYWVFIHKFQGFELSPPYTPDFFAGFSIFHIWIFGNAETDPRHISRFQF